MANYLYPNGIDGATGKYLLKEVTEADLAKHLRTEPLKQGILTWIIQKLQALGGEYLGQLPPGIHAEQVKEAGWGIVFHEAETIEIKSALQPLIDHRAQCVPADRLHKLVYRDGETARAWLDRYNISPGIINPQKVPYYLLLVGGPSLIPFSFQYELAGDYAVGRLAFDDPADYPRYIDSLKQYEDENIKLPNTKKMVFFGTRHTADQATMLSADQLVTPLAKGRPAQNGLPEDKPVAETCGFTKQIFLAEEAKKAKLNDVFHTPAGTQPPAFVFTATHGVGWPSGHANQFERQGALLCQDWKGEMAQDTSPNCYFAASDLQNDARVFGMVVFHFACCSAGTPQKDDFFKEGSQPKSLANTSFIARLPQRLLAHPQVGALAVIGHIDRAFGYSISPSGGISQLEAFQYAIQRTLTGEPVGHAFQTFGSRYQSLLKEIADIRDIIHREGRHYTDQQLASLWIRCNDARNYCLLGDPAVRLRVELL